MNSRSPHEKTTRFALILVCMVCVTSGTRPIGEVDRQGQARMAVSTGLQASFAEPITLAPLSPPALEGLTKPDLATRERLIETFARLPLCFEANQGQFASAAQFISAGAGPRLLLSPNEATLASFRPNSALGKVLKMRLADANPAARMRGLDALPTRANYFIGDDPSKWHTDIPTFGRVVCEKVYPGVDLIYYGNQKQLEYDFVVAPGADPDNIKLKFEGAEKTVLDPKGNLILQAGYAEVQHQKPVAYQDTDGVRREVSVAFNLFADGTAGFRLGDYDETRELVIDPVLVFSTYLGGSADDFGRGIFVDSTGSAYVLGDSQSSDFTHGSPGNADIFMGKFVPNGLAFSYSFFGGSKNDFASGLAVDGDGNAYMSGTTQSDDFPKARSINSALSGPSDAFVIKLNPGNGTFFYSTVLGGAGDETGVSVAIDGAGNAYIAGKTTSTNFSTVNAIQPSYGGGDSDSFVAKIVVDGSAFVYSTYLGGSGTENLVDRSGIAVDAAGNAYVTGDTQSADFPLKDPLRPSKTGDSASLDAYVSKIDPTGSAFVYSTYVGGSGDDAGLGIATDSTGNAYVTGRTESTSFTGSSSTRPATVTTDAFVAKLNPMGSAFAYLTFIGGDDGDESGNAIVVDSTDNAHVTGSAGSGFPTVKSVQSYFTGGDDVLVARLNSAGTIDFSTYLGGSGDDIGLGVSVDSAGSIYVTGFTNSQDFLTNNPLLKQNSGGTDALVSKIDPNTDPKQPVIYDVRLDGKKLTVLGQKFDEGAFVRVNDVPKGTRGGEDPTQILISKKGGKKIKPGRIVQIQVENSNGKRSNLFFFTRPA